MLRTFEQFSSIARWKKVVLQLFVDAVLVTLSFIAAMAVRIDSFRFLSDPVYLYVFVAVCAVTLAAFAFLDVYRALIRFLTGNILFSIGQGAIISAIALYLTCFALDAFLPRSVPIMHAVFVFLSVGGTRFVVRQVFRNANQVRKKPVIIYGAGQAGVLLQNALFHGRDYFPVAFVDDDNRLHKMKIGGLHVFARHALPRLINSTGVRDVMLAIPSASRDTRREIILDLQSLDFTIKTVPDITDIVSGKARISELQAISAEDLLGRDPVPPDPDLMRKNIVGKVIMVSGAGGSIGSELCRKILDLGPTAIVLYEVSEFALYTIEAELSASAKRSGYDLEIYPVLGSVQNQQHLEMIIGFFKVQTIFHTAAYKHVPLLEDNVVEGIRNNVFGTLAITSAAAKHGVESFTLISTDKAVRPTNIMGASKRLAELICQAHAHNSTSTLFSMVRFGNVLYSSGSVIPQFEDQINRGGPVTVTHPEIIRYFMTIAEASQLVIQSSAMASGGDVFVLDMGEPVKIMALAKNIIRLRGLTPYTIDHPDAISPERGDIPILVTGLRKGEKLYEELLIANNPSPTQHPRVMTASEASLPMAKLSEALDRLLVACEAFDLNSIASLLQELPLDYAPSEHGHSASTGHDKNLGKAPQDAENRGSISV